MLEARGAMTLKLSDSYTVGVPDLLIFHGRVILIEMKITRGKPKPPLTVSSWKSLGLTGAQDSRIRRAFRSNASGAVVTGERDCERPCLWVPDAITETDDGTYTLVAVGMESISDWTATLVGHSFGRF